VPLRFRDATLDDVPALAALQNAVAGALTARYGPGPWSMLVSKRSVALAQRHARVRVGRDGKRILTALRLASKKPWAIWPADNRLPKEASMRAIRSVGVVCLVALGALGCGKDDDSDACPEPTQSIVGPDLRPDLSSVPECRLPNQDR